MTRFLTALAALFLTAVTVLAQNWPQWRGPDGNGVAAAGHYPVAFSATNDLLWKAALPGKGGSTPIVWGDRIALTSGVGEGTNGLDGIHCFDWAGKQLWSVTLGRQRPGKHRRIRPGARRRGQSLRGTPPRCSQRTVGRHPDGRPENLPGAEGQRRPQPVCGFP